MSDLTAFLTARLDEDEHRARQAWAGGHRGSRWMSDPDRQLAEVQAKRSIVEDRRHLDTLRPGVVRAHAEWTCRTLAAVYADHPDYRQEWKP